jgi:hypothetical protein
MLKQVEAEGSRRGSTPLRCTVKRRDARPPIGACELPVTKRRKRRRCSSEKERWRTRQSAQTVGEPASYPPS